MNKLPNKPSRLIYLAIDDLEKAEKSPKYSIDMRDWHIANGVCKVCLAGAVMANTLKCDSKITVTPWDLDLDVEYKLTSLDYFRRGRVSEGLKATGIYLRGDLDWLGDEDGYLRINHIAYLVNPEEFKEDMLALAGTLDGIGL